MTESLPEIQKRLKVAGGQINGLIAQIEANSSPVRVAQQLQAVEKAVAGIKSAYVLSQLEALLESSVVKKSSTKSSLDSLKNIAKYLHR